MSLTTLFGDDVLDDADKRALIFTDSVQDAAHRAGFVNQRSHTMSLRSALRGALTADMPLDAWAGPPSTPPGPAPSTATGSCPRP